MVDSKRSAAAKKAWETIRRRYGGKIGKRSVVGFYKDGAGKTRPVTAGSPPVAKMKIDPRVFREVPIAVWGYDSRSTDRVYTVRLNKDGSLSCNCPGWIFSRSCRHVRDVEEKLKNANVGLKPRERKHFNRLVKKYAEKYGEKAALRAAQAEFRKNRR